MKKMGLAILTAGVLMTGSIFVNGVYNTVNRQVTAEEVKPSNNFISVSGEGTIDATPDIAYINAGVTTEDNDSSVAQKKNKDIMIKVMDVLSSNKIDKKDIKTVSYYINPRYDYSNNTSKISGYTVTNSLKITVRDIDMVGKLLDAVSDVGVNTSGGVQYDISDKTDLYNKALAQAVKNAKGKAQALAGAAGVSIGKPVSIDESSSPSYYPVYDTMNYKSLEASGASTPVEKGTMTIKANVSVKYPMQ